jgi:hypothetical protein
MAMKVTGARYFDTLGVTFKVTAETLVNSGFEGCVTSVTFISYILLKTEEIESMT